MAYEIEKAAFAETAWERLSYTRNDRLGVRELIRGCKTGIDSKEATVLEYLGAYISGANDSPSATITDPKANRKTYPGLWRLASVGWSAQTQMYIETLRYGWAESVLTENLPNDECMIQTGSDTRSDSRTLALYWRSIASTAVKTCMDQLRSAGSFSSPVIQGVTHTGKWAIGEIVPIQSDDGSYEIRVSCLKVTEVSTLNHLKALTPVRERVRINQNPFGREGGYTVTSPSENVYTAITGRAPKEGLTLTFGALDIASKTFLEGLTDTQVHDLLGNDADKAKFRPVKKEVTEDAGNTLKLVCAYRWVPLATRTPEADARYISLTRSPASGKVVLKRSWPRIDPAHVDTLIAGANTNTKVLLAQVADPMADGKTYSGAWLSKIVLGEATEDDGVEVIQELTLSGALRLDVKYGKDPDHLIYEFYRWDYSKQQVENFYTQTGNDSALGKDFKWQTPEAGKTKLVQPRKNQDDTWDLYAVYSDTESLTKTDLFTGSTPGKLTIANDYGAATEQAFGWNIPATALKTYSDYYNPTPRVVNQENEFVISRQTEHVFDFRGVRKTYTSVDSGWHRAADNSLMTIDIREGQYILPEKMAAGQDFGIPAAPTENVKYENGLKENKVGSFDGVLTRITFKPQIGDETTIEDNNAQTVKQKIGRYLTAAAIVTGDFRQPGSLPSRTIVKLDVKDNDVGTQDIVKLTITSKSQPATGGEKTALETKAIATNPSADAEVTATAGGTNTGGTADNEKNPDGTYRTRKVDITKVPWSSQQMTVSDDGTLMEKMQLFRNQASAPAAGPNTEVKPQDNGYGGIDAVMIETFLASGAASQKTRHSSAVIDWDIHGSTYRIPLYAWTTSTDSTKPTEYYISAYNVYMFSMSRVRQIRTTITRTLSLSEPSVEPAMATESTNEGAGTSMFRDCQEIRKGVWMETVKTVETTAWGTWGNKTKTLIDTLPASAS